MKYQVGGSLRSGDPTYVYHQAGEQLYTRLKAQDLRSLAQACSQKIPHSSTNEWGILDSLT